jgi:hypothetical protein
MRANARAILIEALRNAHRWLDELLSDLQQTLESLALRIATETWGDLGLTSRWPGDDRGEGGLRAGGEAARSGRIGGSGLE